MRHLHHEPDVEVQEAAPSAYAGDPPRPRFTQHATTDPRALGCELLLLQHLYLLPTWPCPGRCRQDHPGRSPLASMVDTGAHDARAPGCRETLLNAPDSAT